MTDAKIKVEGDLAPITGAFNTLKTAIEGVSKVLEGHGSALKKTGEASKETEEKIQALTEAGKALGKEIAEVSIALSGGTSKFLDYAGGLKKTAAFWKEAYGEGTLYGDVLHRLSQLAAQQAFLTSKSNKLVSGEDQQAMEKYLGQIETANDALKAHQHNLDVVQQKLKMLKDGVKEKDGLKIEVDDTSEGLAKKLTEDQVAVTKLEQNVKSLNEEISKIEKKGGRKIIEKDESNAVNETIYELKKIELQEKAGTVTAREAAIERERIHTEETNQRLAMYHRWLEDSTLTEQQQALITAQIRETKYQADIRRITDESARYKQLASYCEKAADQIGESFSSNFTKVIMHAQTMRQAMHNIAQGITESLVKAGMDAVAAEAVEGLKRLNIARWCLGKKATLQKEEVALSATTEQAKVASATSAETQKVGNTAAGSTARTEIATAEVAKEKGLVLGGAATAAAAETSKTGAKTLQSSLRLSRGGYEAATQQTYDRSEMTSYGGFQVSKSLFAHTQSVARVGTASAEASILTLKEKGQAGIAAMTEAQKTAATKAGASARIAAGAAEDAPFYVRIGRQVLAWLGLETSKTAETEAGAGERQFAETSAAAAAIAETKAMALGMIPAYTEIAAMGAASAVSFIPYAGPGLAGEAFDAMNYLGAAALSIATAAGGWGEVPYDDAPALLHKQEMVLPAQFAVPLREMLTRPNPGYGWGPGSIGSPRLSANGASPGGSPPVTVHYAPTVNAIDTRSARRFFDDHGRYIVDVLAKHHRNFAQVSA